MKITVVYDNEVYRKDTDLKSDWGFSCLIETGKDIILFDTGTNGEILLDNMRVLGINPKKINKIVISHEHLDHAGGLGALLSIVDDVEIYRLGSENPKGKSRLFVVNEGQKIADKIYTTGRLRGIIEEQSLVIEGKEGLYVIVGCSHPGVENILEVAQRYGRVVGIIGGFHDFSDLSILKNLGLISPCHCTRFKREILEIYPNKSMECGVGRVFEI